MKARRAVGGSVLHPGCKPSKFRLTAMRGNQFGECLSSWLILLYDQIVGTLPPVARHAFAGTLRHGQPWLARPRFTKARNDKAQQPGPLRNL